MNKKDGMTNSLELKEAIKRSGLKVGEVAERMGMSRGSLSRKIHQRDGMRMTENNLERVRQILNDQAKRVGGQLTKQSKLIRVEASETHVREHWRVMFFEGGEEVCAKDDVSLYFRDSDWSKAYPLTQKICQVVFDE